MPPQETTLGGHRSDYDAVSLSSQLWTWFNSRGHTSPELYPDAPLAVAELGDVPRFASSPCGTPGFVAPEVLQVTRLMAFILILMKSDTHRNVFAVL